MYAGPHNFHVGMEANASFSCSSEFVWFWVRTDRKRTRDSLGERKWTPIQWYIYNSIFAYHDHARKRLRFNDSSATRWERNVPLEMHTFSISLVNLVDAMLLIVHSFPSTYGNGGLQWFLVVSSVQNNGEYFCELMLILALEFGPIKLALFFPWKNQLWKIWYHNLPNIRELVMNRCGNCLTLFERTGKMCLVKRTLYVMFMYAIFSEQFSSTIFNHFRFAVNFCCCYFSS